MRFPAGGLVRTILDFDRKQLPFVFHFVATTTVAGLIVCVVRWPLVNLLTVFLEPLLEIVIFAAVVAAFVWAIIHALLPLHGIRANRFSPLLLGLAAVAVFLFFPFTNIYLKVNFAINLHSRTAVAQRLLSARSPETPMSGGTADLVHLTGFEHGLSDEGDVMVWHTAKKQMVFFFTFRGILDHFSGFIYSANDVAPEREDFGGEWVEVTHLRKNWYWAASI